MKTSTTALPMVSLEVACSFAELIHTKGVETEPMPAVAQATGYKNATSTPFYMRIKATRLFGLVNQDGAGLTSLGHDYIRPSTEDSKEQALSQAVKNVSAYGPLFEIYNGKRMNLEVIRNNISKTHDLTPECALMCAKAFVESMKFAKLLDVDGVLMMNGESRTQPAITQATPFVQQVSLASPQADRTVTEPVIEGLETFSLLLDATRRRRVIIKAPPTITSKELKRIQEWLASQLLIEDQQPEIPGIQ